VGSIPTSASLPQRWCSIHVNGPPLCGSFAFLYDGWVPKSVPFWVYALVGVAGAVLIFIGGREAAETIQRDIYRDVTIKVERDQKDLAREQRQRLRQLGDRIVERTERRLDNINRGAADQPSTSPTTPNGGTTDVTPNGGSAPGQTSPPPAGGESGGGESPSTPRPPPLPLPELPNVCILTICPAEQVPLLP
jgi:hypothetical protein